MGAQGSGSRWERGKGGGGLSNKMYREKGLNDVCLDGAERLVFDDNEDLLLFFQVDEVTKPGFFGKSVRKDKKKKKDGQLYFCPPVFLPVSFFCFLALHIHLSIWKN